MTTKKKATPKATPAPVATNDEKRVVVFTRMIVARDGKTYQVGDIVPAGMEARYIKRGCAREA